MAWRYVKPCIGGLDVVDMFVRKDKGGATNPTRLEANSLAMVKGQWVRFRVEDLKSV